MECADMDNKQLRQNKEWHLNGQKKIINYPQSWTNGTKGRIMRLNSRNLDVKHLNALSECEDISEY